MAEPEVAEPRTKLTIWDPNRRLVFEQKVEEFARRWKAFIKSYGADPETTMFYVLSTGFEDVVWLYSERIQIRGMASGLGLDTEDLEVLARMHGLPYSIFAITNH